jgi:hypothetical protein
MTIARKCGFVMLLSVLFWIAAPTFACLAETGMHAHDDCCAAMMQGCGATMTNSCCELAPKNAPPAVASDYSPESDSQHALLPRSFSLASTDELRTSQRTLQSLSVPEASPGIFFGLRI